MTQQYCMTQPHNRARRVASRWACAGILLSARVTGEPDDHGTPTFDIPPAQSSRERARQYFVRGGEAASRRSWREAIDLYLESYVQYPHPSTLHNIGHCYYQEGDIYQALFFSARALYEVPQDGVSRLSEPNERAATAQLVRLRQSLGEVVLAEGVALPKPAWVHVDGAPVTKVPLGGGVWGMVPGQRGRQEPVTWDNSDVLLLAEGTHQIWIHDGTWHRTVSIEVIAGTHTLLRFESSQTPARSEGEPATITNLEPARNGAHETGTFLSQAPALSAEAPHLGAEQPPGVEALDDSASASRNVAYVSWVVSGAAFGFSAVAWMFANDLDEELGAACNSGRCPPTHEAAVARYDNTVVASYLGMGLGVVAAATGGLFWVLGSSSNDVSVSVNPRGLALRATF